MDIFVDMHGPKKRWEMDEHVCACVLLEELEGWYFDGHTQTGSERAHKHTGISAAPCLDLLLSFVLLDCVWTNRQEVFMWMGWGVGCCVYVGGGIAVVVHLNGGYLARMDRRSWKAWVLVCQHSLLGPMAPHPTTALPFVCHRNISTTPSGQRLDSSIQSKRKLLLASIRVCAPHCTVYILYAGVTLQSDSIGRCRPCPHHYG